MSKTLYVSKEFTFDSAHRLHNYEGACSQLHGHTWRLQVTLCGRANPVTGLLIDFKDLKALVELHVIDVLDHKDITEYFDRLNGMNTTVENLSEWIFNTLERVVLAQQCELYSIKIWETPSSCAEYRKGG